MTEHARKLVWMWLALTLGLLVACYSIAVPSLREALQADDDRVHLAIDARSRLDRSSCLRVLAPACELARVECLVPSMVPPKLSIQEVQ